MREIVFDTETTGLSPLTGDRVVEIGCVELWNRIETGRSFHAYFNPERPMPSGAEAVHGLTDAFLADATGIGTILNHELNNCGHPLVCLTRMVCTLQLARSKHPGAKHSLDALCTRFGVDRSLRVKHGALIDAQLLAQCYVELTGGRQIGLTLTDIAAERIVEAAEAYAAGSDTLVIEVRPPRAHAPTEEELQAHATFLATLTDPIWHRLDGRR